MTLQIAILLVAGIPVVAVVQPFLPSVEGVGILLVALALLVLPLWRSATNLEGHVRAGAQVILERLAAESAATHEPEVGRRPGDVSAGLLPGLGNARAVRLRDGARAIGRTLRELDLRGLTGATIIAIDRDPADVVYPSADERLRAGDTLILTGTEAAVEAAAGLVGVSDNRPT